MELAFWIGFLVVSSDFVMTVLPVTKWFIHAFDVDA